MNFDPEQLKGKQPDFEKAADDLIRAALKRTHAVRFKVMCQLMRRGIMFKNAKITHQPWPKDKPVP